MDRGACRATVHRVAKIWTGLKQFSIHARKTLLLNMIIKRNN